MANFLNRLLDLMNISYEDYLLLIKDVSFSDVEDPNRFKNIDIAKDRILKAIENNEKIMIYGDYDCDGFSSVSIMVSMFKKLGYSNIGYYIPSRYREGYGINEAMVEKIHQKGYTLLITVDNGVTQFDALKLAKSYGIDVVLTDHHQFLEEVPTCYTIVHPFLKDVDDIIPECGAYVAFMISIKVLGYIDSYLLTLASLATISDLMPLKSYNRNIVRLGLKSLVENHFTPFYMLKELESDIDEKLFGFDIAPKVNAVGRVIEDIRVNRVVDFFTTEDETKRRQVYDFIIESNSLRKSLTLDAAKSLDFEAYKNDLVVVCKFEHMNEGLIGLVANRILNEVKKPSVVFTYGEEGILKGSARSLEGFPLSEVFDSLKDILVRFGGHANAGGLAIEDKNFEEFKRRINELAIGREIHEKKKLILSCDSSDFTFDNYEIIRSLAPFGEGFEEPYLSIRMPRKNIYYLSGGTHIKGTINQNTSFIAFNTNKDFGNEGDIELIGKLALEVYKGKRKLTLKVSEVNELC